LTGSNPLFNDIGCKKEIEGGGGDEKGGKEEDDVEERG